MSVQQRLVLRVMRERAEREGLWDMPLRDVDLDTMADEIVDALYNIPDDSEPTEHEKALYYAEFGILS